MRMTGTSPRNFPFILVGNKAEADVTGSRQVWEDDVREWCHTKVGIMPFIETSLAGDPGSSFRCAERVFSTAATAARDARERYGRFEPPNTLRVLEPDADDAGGGLLAVAGGRAAIAERLGGRLPTWATDMFARGKETAERALDRARPATTTPSQALS